MTQREEEVGLGVGSAAQRYAAYKAEAQAASSLRARWVSTLSFTPDPFQIQALDAVEAGSSVLVAAPTGAGKTIVGQFGAYVALEQGMRAFYTTPIKALSNQKYLELCDLYGADNVGLATGDTSINSKAPVVVMTTEVCRNMIYAGSPLDDLGVVVLDEVHYLADKMRGPVWEEVIIHLPAHVSIIALSATVSNAEEFGAWIREVRSSCEIIVSEQRPVPLYQHMIVGEEIFDLYAPAGKRTLNPELVAATNDSGMRGGRGHARGIGPCVYAESHGPPRSSRWTEPTCCPRSPSSSRARAARMPCDSAAHAYHADDALGGCRDRTLRRRGHRPDPSL